jgi:hypothetical protein
MMADQNRLNPYNLNALRVLMGGGNIGDEDTAAGMLAKQRYLQAILGNVNPAGSEQRATMPFFDSQTTSDPRFSARFSSPMAQFVEGMGYQTPPPSVQGRLGVEGDVFGGQLRAGAQTMAVQFPDGTIRMMPRSFDAGYRTPFMGGELDVGGNIMPKEGFMPQTMYGVQARFNKKF